MCVPILPKLLQIGAALQTREIINIVAREDFLEIGSAADIGYQRPTLEIVENDIGVLRGAFGAAPNFAQHRHRVGADSRLLFLRRADGKTRLDHVAL